jgi:hypothetical protein
MLQIMTKKPTTTAITMAATVKSSTEASDMRRLGGVLKSFGGLEPDGRRVSTRQRASGGPPRPNEAEPRSRRQRPGPPPSLPARDHRLQESGCREDEGRVGTGARQVNRRTEVDLRASRSRGLRRPRAPLPHPPLSPRLDPSAMRQAAPAITKRRYPDAHDLKSLSALVGIC